MELFNFNFKAMGSPCSLSFYAPSASYANDTFVKARSAIAQLEQTYSIYKPDSLVCQINQNAGIRPILIDNQTYCLLKYADQAYQLSGGIFDITSGVLSNLWDFRQAKIPQDAQIKACKSLVDWTSVQWNQTEIYLPQIGMKLDFGGIVKEYAADMLASLMKQNKIDHGLVELGGDIYVLGEHLSGEPWLVDIKKPDSGKRPNRIAQIKMTRGGLASSGDYERNFNYQGVNYCHIINPKTGWPAQGLTAVSVRAEQCVLAGTLATIAMLKGQAAIEWLNQLEVDFVAQDNKGILHTNYTN